MPLRCCSRSLTLALAHTGKDLKAMLEERGINYYACLEKYELVSLLADACEEERTQAGRGLHSESIIDMFLPGFDFSRLFRCGKLRQEADSSVFSLSSFPPRISHVRL